MKTKTLISRVVTAQLICAFVFAYAKIWFSHDAAQMVYSKLPISKNLLTIIVLYDNPVFKEYFKKIEFYSSLSISLEVFFTIFLNTPSYC